MIAPREPSGHEPRAMQRGLLLLEAVAEIGSGATAKQIADRTGVPRASAYRLLNILVADGYLVRIADLSGFALGVRTQQLAAPAAGLTNAQVLERLRSTIRFGVHLAAFGAGTLTLVDRDPDHELADADALGNDPHASAAGKIMLALSVGSGASGPLRALTPHTITTEAELAAHLARVRQDNFASEVDEYRVGRSAVAVPVRDQSGRVMGALTVIGRTERVPTTDAALIGVLTESSRHIRLPSPVR